MPSVDWLKRQRPCLPRCTAVFLTAAEFLVSFRCMPGPQERKLAILLYGFPPGVGATGTAALLNVPKSLERLLEQLAAQGYDLGEAAAKSGSGAAAFDGEALVNALRMQEDQRAISAGASGIEPA